MELKSIKTCNTKKNEIQFVSFLISYCKTHDICYNDIEFINTSSVSFFWFGLLSHVTPEEAKLLKTSSCSRWGQYHPNPT